MHVRAIVGIIESQGNVTINCLIPRRLYELITMSIYFWNSTASKLVFAIFILLLTIFMEATGVINQSHRAVSNDDKLALV